MPQTTTVAVAGLGAVGARVAKGLLEGVPGLSLSAVSLRRPERAAAIVGEGVPVVPLVALAERAEIVVECLPPAMVPEVLEPAIERGRIAVVASVGALLAMEDLEARAARAGARILLPSGGIMALDGLRAAREAGLHSVRIVTRKPLAGFGPKVTVDGEEVDLTAVREPVRVFAGDARDAVAAYPLNVNVAAAASFAGLGPERTEVEIWADPGAKYNCHTLSVESAAGSFTLDVANYPDPQNPRTSALTASSILALLRGLNAPLRAGS